MKLLFVVEQAVFLRGVGLVLAPVSDELPPGTPLFLIRPDGTHVTAVVRPLTAKEPKSRAVAVDLLDGEAPEGTRVFGREPSSTH